MDIENVLEKMSVEVDKSKTYLKGLFNTADTDYKEQFGDSLSDDRRIMMSLTKVGRKYGLQRQEIEYMADTGEKPIHKEDLDPNETMVIDVDEDTLLKMSSKLEVTDDVNHGEGKSSWKRFLSTIPDPIKPRKDFVKIPSLIMEIGPTYYLKMTDLSTGPPDAIEQDGKWGPYTVYPLKVTLVKVSDEDLYDVKYETGEFKGKKAFVNDKDYTMWINDKSMGYFRLFWERTTTDGEPDDRVFTYKFGKKGKYNVYTYGLPKKR